MSTYRRDGSHNENEAGKYERLNKESIDGKSDKVACKKKRTDKESIGKKELSMSYKAN